MPRGLGGEGVSLKMCTVHLQSERSNGASVAGKHWDIVRYTIQLKNRVLRSIKTVSQRHPACMIAIKLGYFGILTSTSISFTMKQSDSRQSHVCRRPLHYVIPVPAVVVVQACWSAPEPSQSFKSPERNGGEQVTCLIFEKRHRATKPSPQKPIARTGVLR